MMRILLDVLWTPSSTMCHNYMLTKCQLDNQLKKKEHESLEMHKGK